MTEVGQPPPFLHGCRQVRNSPEGDVCLKADINLDSVSMIFDQEGLDMARIIFVELPVPDITKARTFYEKAFGMEMTAFGSTYACTMTGDVDLGLQGDANEVTAAALAVIQVDDLEAALAAVRNAGGRITKPIFAFPGGRRFHFVDPSGNELAAMQVAQGTD